MKATEDILNSTTCPSDQMLQDYAYHRLKGSSLRKVELHLAQCEMCNDMVEGMQAMKEEEFNAEVKNLQEKVLVESKTKVVAMWSWKKIMSLAAVLVLILVVSRFFYVRMDSGIDRQLALKNEKKEGKHSEPQQTESTVLEDANEYTESENPESETTVQPGIVDAMKSDQVVPNTANDQQMATSPNQAKSVLLLNDITKNLEDSKTMAGSREAKAEEDLVIADQSAATTAGKATTDETDAIATVSSPLPEQKENYLSELETVSKKRSTGKKNKVTEKSNVADKRNFNEAPTAPNKNAGGSYPKLHARVPLQFMKDGNYQYALETAKDLYQAEPENDTAQFIIGFSLIKLNRIEEGKTYLKQVAENANSPYDREAIFELALLQMKAGDPDYKKTMKALAGGRDSTAAKARVYQ